MNKIYKTQLYIPPCAMVLEAPCYGVIATSGEDFFQYDLLHINDEFSFEEEETSVEY